jgi:AcrR family transcriptional regulator
VDPLDGVGDDDPPDREAMQVSRKHEREDGARMNENVVLTPERILEATEDVLRRFGLAKATVVDVARALDVSHGSVYRHFPSKASLREAVAKRWLERLNAPLAKIAEASGPAPARLERWLRTMISIKQKKVSDDPEMFATYLALAQEACKAVRAHKDGLVDQLAHIVSDGMKQGVFQISDAKAAARAVFDATSRFHHPAHAEEWSDPLLAARIDTVLALLLKGLEAPRKR